MNVAGELGRLIQKGVERRGISVAMLADRAGLSVSGTYKLIAGEAGMPRETTLKRVGTVLGLDAGVLWDAAQKDHRPVDDSWSSWAARMAEVASRLPAQDRARLRDKLLGFAEVEATAADNA